MPEAENGLPGEHEGEHEHPRKKDEPCAVVNIFCGEGKKPHPHHCPKPEYAQFYSDQSQNLAASAGLNLAGGAILFNTNVVSSANIDGSNANVNGEIKFKKAGWYRIFTEVCGALNPLSAPLIAWGLALYRNGVLVPGTTLVDMTLSPDQQSNESAAVATVFFNADDVVSMHNMTSQNLLLNVGLPGVNCASNSASMSISLLEHA